MSGWNKVVFASDCVPCPMCDDLVCPACSEHYAECSCPGPTQDDEYEYKEVDGVMLARRLPDDNNGGVNE